MCHSKDIVSLLKKSGIELLFCKKFYINEKMPYPIYSKRICYEKIFLMISFLIIVSPAFSGELYTDAPNETNIINLIAEPKSMLDIQEYSRPQTPKYNDDRKNSASQSEKEANIQELIDKTTEQIKASNSSESINQYNKSILTKREKNVIMHRCKNFRRKKKS